MPDAKPLSAEDSAKLAAMFCISVAANPHCDRLALATDRVLEAIHAAAAQARAERDAYWMGELGLAHMSFRDPKNAREMIERKERERWAKWHDDEAEWYDERVVAPHAKALAMEHRESAAAIRKGGE